MEVYGSTSAGPRVQEKTKRCIQLNTTSPQQKETSADLRMARPRYGAKITKQRSAYPWARVLAWPTIDDQTMPIQGAIRDSEKILVDVEREPKSHGTKEITA